MPDICFWPKGDEGEVLDFLDSPKNDPARRKAAARLLVDLAILQECWPETMNVSVKKLNGWEPLMELRRRCDKVAYRIFFCLRGSELWLLSAFEK